MVGMKVLGRRSRASTGLTRIDSDTDNSGVPGFLGALAFAPHHIPPGHGLESEAASF